MGGGVLCWCVCWENTECRIFSSGQQRFHCGNYRPQRSNRLLGREISTGSIITNRSEGPFSQWRARRGAGTPLLFTVTASSYCDQPTRARPRKPHTAGLLGSNTRWLSRERIKCFLMYNYNHQITPKFLNLSPVSAISWKRILRCVKHSFPWLNRGVKLLLFSKMKQFLLIKTGILTVSHCINTEILQKDIFLFTPATSLKLCSLCYYRNIYVTKMCRTKCITAYISKMAH